VTALNASSAALHDTPAAIAKRPTGSLVFDAKEQRDKNVVGFPKELEGASITLLGSFNPSIFQPAWLASHELIREDEASAAEIHVIHPELTSFKADWLVLQVQKQRFMVQTSDVRQYFPLRDLVIGIFQLLEHTPFDKMGMNRFAHFRVPSIERWHAVGHFLAPKEPWNDILDTPGLRSLSMSSKPLTDTSTDTRRILTVRVEPSVRIQPGVFFEINDHREAQGAGAAGVLMRILEKEWSDSLQKAEQIAEHLLERASKD